MSAPAFSVIIATYGRGALIEATLLSAARQSHAAHEILVVSDGPATAGLAETVAGVAGARLIELPTRAGAQSGPNNEGWRQATGEWIAYLGHDDIWHPGHLAALASSIAETPEAGFAISGLLYLGPDRDRDDETWVTGFFEDHDERAPFEEFFPPSSFAHRRTLDGPRWPDARAVALPVDAEFLRSQAEYGTRFVSTRRITVIKFAAGVRYLSYLLPQDDEQRWMLGLCADEAVLDAFLSSRLAVARARGTFMHMKHVDRSRFAPGEIAAGNERLRGIDVGELTPLIGSTWVPIGDGDRPPDWYPPESDGVFEWRWSGPSTTPKLVVPYTAPRSEPVTISIHAVDFGDEQIRERVSVRVDDVEAQVSWKNSIETTMTFRAALDESRPTVITIVTGTTVPLYGNSGRQVGIAVTGYHLDPAASSESLGGTQGSAAAERELALARALRARELRETTVRPKGFEPPTF